MCFLDHTAVLFFSDPFSTPARRRRIIADLAKTLLRSYCLIACEHVHTLRLQTIAAIRLQSITRMFLAHLHYKQQIFILHTQNAIKIQSIFRMKLAKLSLQKLKKMKHEKCRKRLVHAMEELWVMKQAKMYRITLQLQKEVLIRLKQRQACIIIQSKYRSHQARIIFLKRFKEFQRLQLKRHFASVMIQRNYRGFIQRLRNLRYQQALQARNVIVKALYRNKYLQFLQVKRQSQASICIQRNYRQFHAKKVLQQRQFQRSMDEENMKKLLKEQQQKLDQSKPFITQLLK